MITHRSPIVRVGFQLVLAAASLILAARMAIHLVSYNYNLSAEANGLSGILHLRHGEALYPDIKKIPYYIYVYCPFHAYFTNFFLSFLPSVDLRTDILVTRSLSLFAFLAALITLWTQVIKPQKISGGAYLLAVALGFSKFADYVTTARNDSLSCLLEISALAFFLKWKKTERTLWFWAVIAACALSLFTRQTGVVVLASLTLWLVWQKRFGFATFLLGAVTTLSAVWFIYFQATSGLAAYDHIVLANVRGFKPFNATLWDHSLLSFLLSYVAFGYFTLRGLWSATKEKPDSETTLFLILFFVSAALPLAGFFRAGGDVNYFFETILVGIFFCARSLDRLKEWSLRNYALVTVQLLLIAGVFAIKTQAAYQVAFRPFETIARRIHQEFPPYVYVKGKYGTALDVYLWDITIHGPEVSDASYIAKNAHPKLRAVLQALNRDLRSGNLSAIILAEDGCGADPVYEPSGYANFLRREVWEDWLCVYRRRDLVPGLTVGRR